MPRWPEGYVAGKWRVCPGCGDKKDYHAKNCRRCADHPRPLLGVTGPDHPAWKTGQRIDEDGYVKTYAPGHPWPRRGGYVFEHVRIVELSIGRKLIGDETVHHEDLNKRNNALSNLVIMGRSPHSALHAKINIHERTRDRLGRFTSGEEVQNASK